MTTHPAYRRAHDRVRAARGKASTHPCADGCGQQAEHWALSPQPEGTTHVVQVEGEARWFSDDVHDYLPMAAQCHKAMDTMTQARRAQQDQDAQPYAHDPDFEVAW